MLSVAKLSPGQEAYYERSVARGLDDYYAGRGESPGVWAGRAARSLDLTGVVAEGDLGLLIAGRAPGDGGVLRKHSRARTITVETIDPETGDLRQVERELRPVAGFDLVFGAPKSVSLLHALGDEETRLAVVRAHESAWRAALVYLEDEACVVRRGQGGAVREQAPGFVAAAYQHRTSRAQEPHLHTHVIVANMAQGSDGAWRALDGDLILRTHRLAAGYLYQSHLRAELTKSLGVEWNEPTKGMAEIRGITESVLREFSTRRRQVVEQLAETGTVGWRSAQVAAIQTREPKAALDLAAARADWWARAQEHGLGQSELETVLGRVRWVEPSVADVRVAAMALVGPEGLTRRAATFTEADVVAAWSQALPGGMPAARVRQLAARLVDLPGVEALDAEPVAGRPRRFTTRQIIELEERALAIAERGVDSGAPVARPAQPGELSDEQSAMARHVCETPDRVVCAVGLAGAGKTTATQAVAEAMTQAGFPVLGAAPSGVAAERLEDDLGIRSTTIHRLLIEERRLPDRAVVVLDEAGMADTRSLVQLLERVDRARGKLIMIGDPKQLASVGPGGLFPELIQRLGAAELHENRRQLDPIERDLLAQVREGRPVEYLANAARSRRLLVAERPEQAREQLLADWWANGKDAPEQNLMLAYRRSDVRELNAAAQALMDGEGRLGAERLRVAGEEIAAGDRILCRRNEPALGLTNGTRGMVTSVDPAAGEIAITTDRGNTVCVPRGYLDAGHVQLGYAMTGHAAQGLTAERAYVLAPSGGANQEWGYVALSRARRETRIYLAAPDLDPDLIAGLDRPDALRRLVRGLEAPAAEPLASKQLGRRPDIGIEL